MKNFLLPILVLLAACSSSRQATQAVHRAHYETGTSERKFPFAYADPSDPYLQRMVADYDLNAVVSDAPTDLDRAAALLDWTHRQWRHNGSNVPDRSDAISIVEEARAGKKFRCVEYGIVSSAAMSALGLPARVLGLRTADVETRKWGAGHVLAEVYLPDLQKWAMVDGQFNVIPTLNGTPLHAVEYRNALVGATPGLQLIDASGPVSEERQRNYRRFIEEYLYHFTVGFNQQQHPDAEPVAVDGKHHLMLLPIGTKVPTLFQRNPTAEVVATHSVTAFYPTPP